jgi:Ca2+-binding EF-hand superfamily protein
VEKGIQVLMKTHDKDSSGFLDKKEVRGLISELCSNLSIKQKKMTQEEFDEIYNGFDKNGDGYIQRAEIREIVYQMSGIKQSVRSFDLDTQAIEDQKKIFKKMQ